MPGLSRLTRLARYVLLLLAAACQRPIYQLPAMGGYSLLVAAPISPGGPNGPAVSARPGTATAAGEPQPLRLVQNPHRPAASRPVGKLRRATMPTPDPPAGIADDGRRPGRPRQPAARRPALDNDTQLKLMALGGVLLTAAGLALCIVVGGWVAVPGGILLALCGLGLLLFSWYVNGIGRASQR